MQEEVLRQFAGMAGNVAKDRQLFLVPISVAGWLGGTIIIGAIAACDVLVAVF
jgi:hypothetical protein